MVIVVVALGARPASAQSSVLEAEVSSATHFASGQPGRRSLAVAVSGGASLGAYEGGFLYSLIEDLRRMSPYVETKVFSGTSAGALNALLSVLQKCADPVEHPTDSAFYRTWMPLSFDRLFDPRAVGPVSALSRSAMEEPIQQLEEDFNAGLDADCDVLLGLTGTRVKPYVVSGAEGRLRLPRMSAHFLLRVEGRGPGRPPRVSNYVGPRDRSLPQLPLDGDGADPFESVVQLILASAAFPFAFAPVSLAHCPGYPGQRRCRPEDARSDLFLDGGIFDQNPVDVGFAGLTASSATAAEDAQLFLLDPFQRLYPRPVSAEDDDTIDNAVAYARAVASGFVETARSQGLERLLREDPDLERRLIVSASKYPPYGELAFFFLSLFEEGFRHFDFILGMMESRRAVLQAQTLAILMGYDVPPEAFEQPQEFDPDMRWADYRCVAAVLGEEPLVGEGLAQACAGTEERLLPLAMVSRERVYDACRPDRLRGLDPSQREWVKRHPDCHRAAQGLSPPAAGPDWQRASAEGELQWVFRRLDAHGYRFVDLGSTGRGDSAFEDFRRKVEKLLMTFADAQTSYPALPRALARLSVNQLAYRPPRRIFHLGVGSAQEVGLSRAVGPGPTSWLRLTGTLELTGLSTVLSVQEDYLALSATLGAEAEILPISGPDLQFRTGVRGGWSFASSDSGGFGSCRNPSDSDRPCSRPVVAGVFSFHLIDFLRIGLAGHFLIPTRDDEKLLFELRPTLGAQLIFD